MSARASVIAWFVGALAYGCSGPLLGGARDLAPTPRGVEAAIQGTWQITDSGGEAEGQIRFDDDRMETSWQEVTLFGAWDLDATNPAAPILRLRVERATQNGVEERYGVVEDAEIRLVFTSHDTLYALEAGGAWTSWSRMTAQTGTP